VAGALLSFALSFDEIIVTNFLSGTEMTVPKFIFNNIRQPRNRPIVNVVAVAAMLVMLIPVILAQRLAGGATKESGTTAVGQAGWVGMP
jgi:putative spermidine/putrescine transport system permease protein